MVGDRSWVRVTQCPYPMAEIKSVEDGQEASTNLYRFSSGWISGREQRLRCRTDASTRKLRQLALLVDRQLNGVKDFANSDFKVTLLRILCMIRLTLKPYPIASKFAH